VWKLYEVRLINIDKSNKDELEIYHSMRESAFGDGSFVADSPKVVNILLQTDIKVKSILSTKEYYDEFSHLLESKTDAKFFVASKDDMQKIVGHKIHHNCMMHGVRPKDYKLSDLDDGIIMLDEITSTENVGSIARSAAALKVGSYLLPKQSPHPYSRRALRVSMGHISKLKISIYDDISSSIKRLKSLGYKVYAAELSEDAISLSDVKVHDKWVLLMGHEGRGISAEVLSLCDEVVYIEMAEGVRSLNVAVAASLMMYKFTNS
jgi:tRNA G18 (ribose-2'-O)-methylase SpoU